MSLEEKSDTRTKILHAALEQFAGNGFAGTSVRQICDAAGVNVAAVSYYFHSKEQLYHEVFKAPFENISESINSIPGKVHDADTWKTALLEWITTSLLIITDDKPPMLWMVKLIAFERTNPSSVFPMLSDNFFKPLRKTLARLIRMGLPEDADDVTVQIWDVSVASQVLVFMHRTPPWDQTLIPRNISKQEWLDRTSRHIASGITSRLSFRTHEV